MNTMRGIRQTNFSGHSLARPGMGPVPFSQYAKAIFKEVFKAYFFMHHNLDPGLYNENFGNIDPHACHKS